MKDCRKCQGCGLVAKKDSAVLDGKGKTVFGVAPCSCTKGAK